MNSDAAVDDLSADVPELLELLTDTHPTIALAMARALDRAGSPGLRAIATRLLDAISDESLLNHEVDAIVSRGRAAQPALERWTDGHVDALLLDVARAFAECAEELAEATVAETGMGSVPDKTIKNRFASLGIWQSLAGQVAQGALSFDVDRQVTEVASPVGVVFAVVPVTNPVATVMFKTLIALKARNALILSVPRQAARVGERTVGIVRDVLTLHGLPADLVQSVKRRGRNVTRRLMRHPDVALVLATGGRALVDAAYSSGKPAIGVGPGNAPAWIGADVDLDRAAAAIVASKTFDNGLICGAEHNLVVDDCAAPLFAEALMRHGAAILTPGETRRFTDRATDGTTGRLRRELVGQSAESIAAAIGIARPYPIRLLIAPATFPASASIYHGEKLAPFLSMFTVTDEDEGMSVCRALLEVAGAGHTAVIHSMNAERVQRFAREMPAGRILVNSPGTQGCCGMTTGLVPSLTLGCGTFGGNSTTDNITYRHLLNVKRVASHREPPADERGPAAN
jgi:acyl-CoA reductase-like NAD-dependent aldehyde dehydrogenase